MCRGPRPIVYPPRYAIQARISRIFLRVTVSSTHLEESPIHESFCTVHQSQGLGCVPQSHSKRLFRTTPGPLLPRSNPTPKLTLNPGVSSQSPPTNNWCT